MSSSRPTESKSTEVCPRPREPQLILRTPSGSSPRLTARRSKCGRRLPTSLASLLPSTSTAPTLVTTMTSSPSNGAPIRGELLRRACAETAADHSRARRFFLTTSKDMTGRLYTLYPVEGYRPKTFAGHRDAVVASYFSADHKTVRGMCLEQRALADPFHTS
jgi:hypothetical protein